MKQPGTCPTRRVFASSPLLTFVLITFGVTWIGWVPVAILSHVRDSRILANPLVSLSPFAFGPTAAGIIVTGMTEGRAGVRRLMRRVVAWRVRIGWYLVVLFLPLMTFLLAGYLKAAVSRVPMDFTHTAIRVQYPDLSPLVLLVPALIAGVLWGPINEEIGWRGYALPYLQRRLSPFVASIVLGIMWGLWHLPLFWIKGMVQSEMPIFAFMVSILVNTFLYTWVHNNTSGSILMAIIMHNTFNTFTAYVPIAPIDWWTILVTATVVAAAVLSGPKAWFKTSVDDDLRQQIGRMFNDAG